MNILVISDIHGNYPALRAVADHFEEPFELILNGGDTTVYGPFPNETVDWLRERGALSILGNTDRKIITLLNGKTFRKPGKAEKRIMYGWTSAELTTPNADWLKAQPLSRTVRIREFCPSVVSALTIGMYHGSPDDPDEFLFADTPDDRFRALAAASPDPIITVGHSHSPFHRHIDGIHFVNPGSVGRMFDGDPRASCAVIRGSHDNLTVSLHRVEYPVEEVITALDRLRLPPIYQQMYAQGRKLN